MILFKNQEKKWIKPKLNLKFPLMKRILLLKILTVISKKSLNRY